MQEHAPETRCIRSAAVLRCESAAKMWGRGPVCRVVQVSRGQGSAYSQDMATWLHGGYMVGPTMSH